MGRLARVATTPDPVATAPMINQPIRQPWAVSKTIGATSAEIRMPGPTPAKYTPRIKPGERLALATRAARAPPEIKRTAPAAPPRPRGKSRRTYLDGNTEAR